MTAILKRTGERGMAYQDESGNWHFVLAFDAPYLGAWTREDRRVERRDLVLIPGGEDRRSGLDRRGVAR